MPEEERKTPFPEPPKNPLEIIQNVDSAVRNADDVLSGVDDKLRGFDDQLNSTPERRVQTETREPEAGEEESRSSCLKCSWEHLGDSEQQLREASSASPGSERLKTKLQNAIDGLYQAERRHLGPKYPELAAKVRSLRKMAEKGVFKGEEISTEQLISEIRSLREKVHGKYEELYPDFECGWCSDLAEDVSSKFDSDEDRIKVMEAIYALAEEGGAKGKELSEEDKAKYAKVLKDYGVYEEVMSKATRMLEEAS